MSSSTGPCPASGFSVLVVIWWSFHVVSVLGNCGAPADREPTGSLAGHRPPARQGPP
jgi:hypothetical protein